MSGIKLYLVHRIFIKNFWEESIPGNENYEQKQNKSWSSRLQREKEIRQFSGAKQEMDLDVWKPTMPAAS